MAVQSIALGSASAQPIQKYVTPTSIELAVSTTSVTTTHPDQEFCQPVLDVLDSGVIECRCGLMQAQKSKVARVPVIK